jgi:hypothetical protein
MLFPLFFSSLFQSSKSFLFAFNYFAARQTILLVNVSDKPIAAAKAINLDLLAQTIKKIAPKAVR